MKKTSLFVEFIAALWPKLSLYIKEKVNGQTDGEKKLTYLHKQMLNEVYSADQKWEGSTANTIYVAADVVALDSPLPVKARPSIGNSNGKLPKIGMKKALSESDLTALDTMKAQLLLLEQSAEPNQQAIARQKRLIINKLSNDSVACSVGIDEKLEAAFLEGISNGVALVEDENNVGTALRANYGYFPDHTFHLETQGVLDHDDIEKVITKADADGNALQYVMLALSKYNEMRKTQWARELVANYKGQTFDENTKLPVPTAKIFDEAFADEFNGLKFIKVDRTVIYEKNSKRTPKKPFNADHIIFLSDYNVGSLVYSTCAEANHPVAGVEYATVDIFKLISKYSINEPLQEWTSGQALALPVIEDVDQIYMLDCSEDKSQKVDDTAEKADTTDEYVTIAAKKYKKSDVAAELVKLGVKADATNADATLIKKVNNLDEESLEKFYAALTPVTA